MSQAKRALVTGAGGFIGSHLVEALVRDGQQVTAMVHYNAMRDIGNLRHLSADVLANVEVVFGDVTDGEFCRELVAGNDYVFHLAALIAIPYSYSAPRSYVRTNVEGTLNMLEACRKTGVERMLHTSTSEVYGSALYVPIDEQHPLQGQSPYSASKIGADMMAQSYFRSFDTPVVTVRPFNTYGPRQSARAFIPTVIGQARLGPTIMLGATTPIRDLTFATDTAQGFLAAAKTPGIEGETVNLGVGHGFTVAHVAETILELMGVDGEIVLDPKRIRPEKSEVDRLVSANAKFQALSGWTPKVELREGLQKTIEFFLQEELGREARVYVV
jgi:NAD dependent epimerase/dehydratase